MKHIPDEIWHQIFAHFEPVLPEGQWLQIHAREDRRLPRTLTSICRVSRQFCRVAQPLHFRTIRLRGWQFDEWRQHRYYMALTRSLATCPELGLQTRTISLHDLVLPITPGFRSMLRNLLPSLDLPTAMRRHMEGALEPNEMSNHRNRIDISLFLIALMPNIRLLDIEYPGVEALIWMISGRADAHRQLVIRVPGSSHAEEDEVIEDPRSDKFRAPGSQGLPRAYFANFGLPNLEELRIRWEEDGHSRQPFNGFAKLEAVLLHQNLKTLRLRRIDWRLDPLDIRAHSPMWPNEPCGVQFLELRECKIDASSLRHILTRFTGLRTLNIQLCEDLGFSSYLSRRWPLGGFGSALRDLGQKVVNLNLNTTCCRVRGHLGSLREMRSLRHLTVVVGDLVDDLGDQPESIPTIAALLPDSIETLLLHWIDECKYGERYGPERSYGWVSDAVRKLLELGHMPRLRQVSIKRHDGLVLTMPSVPSDCEPLEGEFDGLVGGWDMTVVPKLWMDSEVTFTKSD